MPFTTINPLWIEVGEPTKKELFLNIKNSLDDHETRISSVEAAISKVVVFNSSFIGYSNIYNTIYTNFSQVKRVHIYRAEKSFIITNAIITNVKNGTSGSLSIDVRKGVNTGSLASIFSQVPSILSGTGDGAISTNAVITSGIITVGEYISIEVLSMMGGQDSDEFQVQLFGDI